MSMLPSSSTITIPSPLVNSLNSVKTAVIDHHVVSDNADRNDFYKSLSASFIDPDAAAAGLLVYKLKGYI